MLAKLASATTIALLMLASAPPAAAPATGVGLGAPGPCGQASYASFTGTETGAGAWTFLVAFADPCEVGGIAGGALPFAGTWSPGGGGCISDLVGLGFFVCFTLRASAGVIHEYDITFCCPNGVGSAVLIVV